MRPVAVHPTAVQPVAGQSAVVHLTGLLPVVDRLAAAVLRAEDPAKAAVYPAAVQPVVVLPVADLPLRVLRRERPPAVWTQPAAAPAAPAMQTLRAVPARLPQAIQPVMLLPPAIPSKKAPPLQAQRATPILPTKLPLRAVNPIRLLLKAYQPTKIPVIQKHPASHTLRTTLQIQLLKKQVRLIQINPGKTTLSRKLNQGRIPRKPVLLPINLLQAGTGV